MPDFIVEERTSDPTTPVPGQMWIRTDLIPGYIAAPTGVTVTPGDAQNSIAWSAVSGATAYDIKWGTSTGVHGTTISDVTSPYAHSSLTNDTTYYYVVVARKIGATSADSSESSGTPVAESAWTQIFSEDCDDFTANSWQSVTLLANGKYYGDFTGNNTALAAYKDFTSFNAATSKRKLEADITLAGVISPGNVAPGETGGFYFAFKDATGDKKGTPANWKMAIGFSNPVSTPNGFVSFNGTAFSLIENVANLVAGRTYHVSITTDGAGNVEYRTRDTVTNNEEIITATISGTMQGVQLVQWGTTAGNKPLFDNIVYSTGV